MYLDDLATLQENHFEMWSAVLDALTGGAEAFLLKGVNRLVETDGRVTVTAGTLVTEGQLCAFERMTTPKAGDTIYVAMKRTAGDERDFEDGQRRACSETLRAWLTTDPTGAEKAWKLDELKTLAGLLRMTLAEEEAMENAEVVFFNDYTGTVKIVPQSDGNPLFAVDIKPTGSGWHTAEAPAWKGALFRIDDDAFLKKWGGKQSPVFTYGGTDCRLIVGTTGLVAIRPEPYPDDFYLDSYSFAYEAVAVTFRLSQFTESE